ncbi:MAG: multiheme c-type cytochrome [Parasphingorhabdus sp.]|uniref:multiheme c-type cytochrome n=1 Tax=Parasphingorhabdus sp. TaxID=2709688 RepID=UPI00329A2310
MGKNLSWKRSWSILAASLFCFALAGVALFISSVATPAPVEAAQDLSAGTHLGVASCGGTTCHGRQEADGEVVRQDELMRWQEESTPGGAHSRAFRVLREPRSIAIAKRLGIKDAASSQECLGCHSTPATKKGPRFQANDGVGCEACHGPSSGWLSAHYAVGANHAKNVSLGLAPLDNPKVRASTCLDCHFGSAKSGQFVDHRIMAAGHPRISFELDLFSTLQQHHDEDVDYVRRKGKTNAVRFWAVGQSMALERSLNLFSKPALAQEGLFPEFYFYDCHSCHRRIYDDASARPTSINNPGRPIPEGMPPYNDENMIMLSAAIKVAAPDLAGQFDARSKAFHKAMGQGRGPAVQAAARLRQTATALADRFSRANFDREQTFRIMETIAGQAISPRFTDYEGSVQAVMAIDTLLNGLVNNGQVSEAAASSLRGQINVAYKAVDEPNSYKPLQFRRALGSAVRTIRALR